MDIEQNSIYSSTVANLLCNFMLMATTVSFHHLESCCPHIIRSCLRVHAMAAIITRVAVQPKPTENLLSTKYKLARYRKVWQAVRFPISHAIEHRIITLDGLYVQRTTVT